MDGLCALASTLAPLDLTGAGSLVLTIREPSKAPRVLAWNVVPGFEVTRAAPAVSPQASVHALLYACGLDAFELAEGELPASTALEPPAAVFRLELASRTWSPQTPADVLPTIEAEAALRFDLDPCPAYEQVATATTAGIFDEPWLVALSDGVLALGTFRGDFSTYVDGRLQAHPETRLTCAWGDGVEAWALDVDGCPGRLSPPHTFLRDPELPCLETVARGFCIGLAAVPGSKDLVAATFPTGVARIDGDEWRALVDPRTFSSPNGGGFALDRTPSEVLFASWPTGTNPGLTFSWSNSVATQLQLPMALEATHGLAALENGDFVLGAQARGLATLYHYRNGVMTWLGEITQEIILHIAPARAGFLAVTNHGIRHFASGRDCGILPIDGARPAIETEAGIVALRGAGGSIELVELRRTRTARGCFPRELPSRDR